MLNYLSEFEIRLFTVNSTPELVIQGVAFPVIKNGETKLKIKISSYQNNSDASEKDCELLCSFMKDIAYKEACFYINTTANTIFSNQATSKKFVNIKAIIESNIISFYHNNRPLLSAEIES